MHLRLSLAVLMGCMLSTFAARAFTQIDVEALLSQGNDRGAIACATCHQADGAGNAQAGFPSLAGMDSEYAMRQLEAFIDGTRKSPVMAPIAKALSDEERKALAVYYERQERPAVTASGSAPAMLPVGERLAQSGDWQGRELPACVSRSRPSLVTGTRGSS